MVVARSWTSFAGCKQPRTAPKNVGKSREGQGAAVACAEQQVVKYEVLNPKCITMGELYGEFNPLTQEWHDGLASTIMRRAVADEGEHKR